MLNSFSKTRPSGFTLIELLIGILILGILASIAVPSFQGWIKNSQIRNAAESIANGLQRARATAVLLNTNVAFTIGAGANAPWSVYVVATASGIDSGTACAGSQNVTLTKFPTGSTTVTFNNFGNVMTTNPGGAVPAAPFTEIDLAATGGRPLNVKFGLGGSNAKMCDPSLTSGPRSCN
jgi:type IV fimbrial biogenesis protein FimT